MESPFRVVIPAFYLAVWSMGVEPLACRAFVRPSADLVKRRAGWRQTGRAVSFRRPLRLVVVLLVERLGVSGLC